MGTRNLVCVVLNGEFKVAQYGQWDGYPSGQGATIVDFLRNTYDPVLFRQQVAKAKVLSQAEVTKRWEDAGATSEWVSMDVADKFKKKNYHLSRDCAADILEYVQKAANPEVVLNTEFAADSLFCEWAYVVDLDNDTLEVYKGFNKEPVTNRFSHFPLLKEGGEYKHVRLVRTFKIGDIAEDAMSNLENEIYKEENGNEE